MSNHKSKSFNLKGQSTYDRLEHLKTTKEEAASKLPAPPTPKKSYLSTFISGSKQKQKKPDPPGPKIDMLGRGYEGKDKPKLNIKGQRIR